MTLFLFRVILTHDTKNQTLASSQILEIFMEAENLCQASGDLLRQFGGPQHCKYEFIREVAC